MIVVVFLPLPVQAVPTTTFEEATQEGINQASLVTAQIESILKDERLNGAITGVSIRKGDTGEIIYSSFGDTRLHPASNMKLLTVVSALETLGIEYQFSTEVWIDGKIKENILQGDVYVKGKGDPTLLKTDFDQWAKDLKESGIHQINGNIIGDDSWYDDVRLSQDLNWSDESNYTGAQVSALTLSPNKDYDAGTVIVEVSPASKVGEPARLALTPATEYVNIINQTKTVDQEAPKKVSIEREHGTNTIIVNGTIPLNGEVSRSWVAVWEPTKYALDVFKKSLQENGIKFSGKTELKIGITPKNATLLTDKKSMPLKDLIIPFMKLSNNGHGEILTKEIGKVMYGEGSWDKGLQVIEETVTSFGIDPRTFLLRDGSGMSHKNMIPANELSQFLYAIQKKSWFHEFEHSLPVAGIPDRLVGGTLRSRLTEKPVKGNVKAKTGTIAGVSTLSGYVTTTSGEKWIFSIMINNHLSDSVKSIEDEIVKILTGL
ncbi:D-alanyl-D-alanine carboxypeptidase/D-alanyl-D-alanine-endopeptidase [Bacillus sp. V3B]|uniref:D-alanyl-D-alanine carboxypeptidase/D-alanyl-D-alanine endopeptidase n=1 Tax=Bacillus sp. V3B TaxID=2804915 RepID=UPI002108FCB6|nr:D-alanyl-D-alanine carboxypeptidase/D-alanyl-D-alanine-endopeptidase [Bacillus sp. V3B]